MKNNSLQTFKKNDVIFKEGTYQPTMFDIVSGSVGIYANYGTPEEKLLTTLNEEDFFGEMGMIECRPRSATAVALERETVLMEITQDEFSEYFKEKPAKVVAIMQHMSSRLRQLSKDYLEACRTIDQCMELETEKKPKSESLIQQMIRFAGFYRESWH